MDRTGQARAGPGRDAPRAGREAREDGGEVRVDDGGAERGPGPVRGRVQRRPPVDVAALHQPGAAAADLHQVPANAHSYCTITITITIKKEYSIVQ